MDSAVLSRVMRHHSVPELYRASSTNERQAHSTNEKQAHSSMRINNYTKTATKQRDKWFSIGH